MPVIILLPLNRERLLFPFHLQQIRPLTQLVTPDREENTYTEILGHPLGSRDLASQYTANATPSFPVQTKGA